MAGISWDARSVQEFSGRLEELQKKLRAAMPIAAGQVANQIIDDAKNIPPTVPKVTGDLRSAGTVEVLPLQPGPKVVAIAGFNRPQAARLHEHPEFHFTEPDSGGKYLESKLRMFAEQYLKVFWMKVRRATGL